ncbi:MAG: hypothetical protein ACWA47_08785 [Brevirhabdus sp.]
MPTEIITTDQTSTYTVDDTDNIILTRGTVVTAPSGIGFNLAPGALTATLWIEGEVYASNTGINLSTNDPTANFDVVIGQNGLVTSAQGYSNGVSITGDDSTVTNHGEIIAGGRGISTVDAVTIVNTGMITANAGYSISMTSNNTTVSDMVLRNTGTITGQAAAFFRAGNVEIDNSGYMSSMYDGIIYLNNSLSEIAPTTMSISNSGEMRAGWTVITVTNSSSYAVDLELFNSGLIEGGTGAIDTSTYAPDGDDKVFNTGTINGAIDLDDGTDLIDNEGIINGNISFGGFLTDTLRNSGLIVGTVDLGDGTNVMTNSGEIRGWINGGYGNDTITNSGLILGRVDLDGGFNKLTNAATGIIDGDVTFGSSQNTFVNRGHVTGDVDMGDALTNRLVNTGSLDGTVNGGYFTDTIENHATIFGAVSTENGTDTVINRGRMESGLDTGADADAVTNSGTIVGDLVLGTGDDSYNGRFGVTTGAVLGGTGNDSLTGGVENDLLDGGADNDLLSGRGGNDTLIGDAGFDTLLGGYGNDSLNGGGRSDLLDGGRGDDTLTGGGSVDTFVFGRKAGDDVITDFADNTDQIDLSAFGLQNFNALNSSGALSQDQDGVIIDLSLIGGSGSIYVEGMTLAQMDAADFVF